MNDATRALIAAGMKLPLAGFVLDLGGEQLRDAQGKAVDLRPQAWAVLRHLALNAGRLVGKNELLDAIWPGLIVTDGSLTQAVSDVREALGAAGRQVIKTVPKRGYLLVADAVLSSEETLPARPIPRTNLPAEPDPLIGREADIATLTAWFDAHRLITVLGAGGIGKTRLAQAVARQRTDQHASGVWWVDLAALSTAAQLAPAIAAAANLPLGDGDATVLLRALAHRDTLLVLDNCEHLAAGLAPIVQAILAAAPAVRLLTTSQEALRVPGEHVYRLDTLAVPPAGAALAAARGWSALQLLEQRAQAADRRFTLDEDSLPAAITLCRQLDGIPLAIEMAAAHLPVLGIATVQRLVAERALSNATRSAPLRQRTLRATLEWSHALLTADEQAVLRRLSVFAGSFRLESSQQVAAADGLTEASTRDAIGALIGKSLLQVQRSEPPRYRLLETMRAFAAQGLAAAGETDATLQRHGLAMANLADEAEATLWVLPEAPWLRRYALDQPDLQIAFERACQRNDADVAAVVAAALASLESVRRVMSPVQQRVGPAMALLPSASPLARALLWDSIAIRTVASAGAKLAAAGERVAAWRALSNAKKLYWALARLATAAEAAGQPQAADAALAEMDSMQAPDWPPRLLAMGNLAASDVSAWRGDVPLCRSRSRAALALSQRAGAHSLVMVSRGKLADAALMAGDLAEAIAQGGDLIAALRELDQPATLGIAYGNLCAALLMSGDNESARCAAAAAQPLLRDSGMAVATFDHFSLLSTRTGHNARAALLLGLGDAWYASVGETREPNEARLAELAADAICAELGPAECTRLRAEGATLDPTQADVLVGEALAVPAASQRGLACGVGP